MNIIKFISSRQSWSIPYAIFAAIFVVLPLLLIVVFAFTDENGALTLYNFQKFLAHAASHQQGLPGKRVHPADWWRQLGCFRQVVPPRRHPSPLSHRGLSAPGSQHRQCTRRRYHRRNSTAQHQQHGNQKAYQRRGKHQGNGAGMHRTTGCQKLQAVLGIPLSETALNHI